MVTYLKVPFTASHIRRRNNVNLSKPNLSFVTYDDDQNHIPAMDPQSFAFSNNRSPGTDPRTIFKYCNKPADHSGTMASMVKQGNSGA
jgi:hypothetical protein